MSINKKKIFLIFEFSVPPYRTFLIDWLKKKYILLGGRSGNDKFSIDVLGIKKARLLAGNKDTKIFFFNPFVLLKANTIITTFNLRRPHTWVYMFLFPYKKWILWGQGEWKSKNLVINLLRKCLLSLSSGYVVYTKRGKKNLIDQGYPEEKVSVAMNTLYVPNAELLYGSSYILYFGRMQKRKGVEDIIPYLREVGFRLRVVGDGPHKAKIREAADKAGVSDLVDFYPETFDPEEIKEHFSGAVCYLSPGHVGLGVVQSFSYGVPVVTIVHGEHAPEFDYCSHNNSYLASNTQDLVKQIIQIKDNLELHNEKKKGAFDFYLEHLSHKNMIEAFRYQLEEI